MYVLIHRRVPRGVPLLYVGNDVPFPIPSPVPSASRGPCSDPSSGPRLSSGSGPPTPGPLGERTTLGAGWEGTRLPRVPTRARGPVPVPLWSSRPGVTEHPLSSRSPGTGPVDRHSPMRPARPLGTPGLCRTTLPVPVATSLPSPPVPLTVLLFRTGPEEALSRHSSSYTSVVRVSEYGNWRRGENTVHDTGHSSPECPHTFLSGRVVDRSVDRVGRQIGGWADREGGREGWTGGETDTKELLGDTHPVDVGKGRVDPTGRGRIREGEVLGRDPPYSPAINLVLTPQPTRMVCVTGKG